jgi:hypothetical protein
VMRSASYLITLSALASTFGGIVTPICLAMICHKKKSMKTAIYGCRLARKRLILATGGAANLIELTKVRANEPWNVVTLLEARCCRANYCQN